MLTKVPVISWRHKSYMQVKSALILILKLQLKRTVGNSDDYGCQFGGLIQAERERKFEGNTTLVLQAYQHLSTSLFNE